MRPASQALHVSSLAEDSQGDVNEADWRRRLMGMTDGCQASLVLQKIHGISDISSRKRW